VLHHLEGVLEGVRRTVVDGLDETGDVSLLVFRVWVLAMNQ
jgi:hypothetical protein